VNVLIIGRLACFAIGDLGTVCATGVCCLLHSGTIARAPVEGCGVRRLAVCIPGD